MGQMFIMNREGDTRYTWDAAVPNEVDMARRTFDQHLTQRYAAFRVKDDWRQGEQIREFDPNAERIIFVPAVVGG